MSTGVVNGENWLLDDDVNLFDSLACLLEDDEKVEQDMDDISDLDTTCPTMSGGKVKQEKPSRGGAKKRKFNPDSDVIAAATDETLKSLELDPNSKEGKQKRRQIRNRLSAQFHRDRKNAHINTLEDQMTKKDLEIASLRDQVTALLVENEYLRKMNPGAAVPARAHSMSMVSYPDGMSHSSTIATDSEEDGSVQSFLYYLNPGVAAAQGFQNGNVSDGSTYSITTPTVSPNDSPYHQTTMEKAAPHSAATLPANARGSSNQGTNLLQVPAGLARPLSIITMVCMVSIMLLGGQQAPGMASYQFTPYQQQQRAQYLQYHLSGAQGSVPLAVGSDMLALMRTEAGAHNVELRQVHIKQENEEVHHGRRLSEEPSDEDSTATETSASKGIAALKIESPRNGSRRHNNLRRSHADMAEEVQNDRNLSDRSQPRSKQSRRQVIFSTGVVSRGLVEDSYSYRGEGHAGGALQTGLIPHLGRMHGSAETGEEGSDAFMGEDKVLGSEEYRWPASQAFDYAVQSYSKVVLTQGQALLDPSLTLSKNPFAWTRAMFGGAAETTEEDLGSSTRSTHQRGPTVVDADGVELSGEYDNEAMDLSEEAPLVPVTTLVKPLSPVRVLPSDIAPVGSESNVLVSRAFPALLGAPHHQQYNNVPAVIPSHKLGDFASEHYDSEVPSEHSVINKLLAESNFMTLKLPASSIRVGKTWTDSKDGTVESIMEVFNITDGEEKTVFGHGGEASVEINCIILGAKLVISDSK